MSTTTPTPYIESPEHQDIILALKKHSCLDRISSHPNIPGHCPGIWDGILCWDQTPANQLSVQRCPGYIAGFQQHANASKQCTANATWFSHEVHARQWTNFSQCFSGPEATVLIHFSARGNVTLIQDYMPALKIISQVGYGVSLVSLVVAFVILASIKKLRCPRNMLHMHLFVSFIMRAFMALLKNSLFVMGVGLSSAIVTKNDDSFYSEQEVNWECKLIMSLWQYFMMANYSWILMEGLYLHNLIFLALFSDSSSITLYVALGWGLPALFVIPWAVCRVMLENTFCWTVNDNTTLFLLIRAPTTVSIVLNFLLFLNIVRVLLLKLRSSVSEDTRTYRRWAKSTLVLVPLFGVHYMMFLGLSYSMGIDETVELAWLFCDQLFASFQGFFVAVLYCFLNGEVRTELSKAFNSVPWSGHDTASNGFLRTARFRKKSRHKNPRASCYSSTSFTSVSVVPNSTCCPNKKRAASGVKCYAHVNDVTSHVGQERRWSKSDYSAENKMELTNMADSKLLKQ